MRYLYSMPARAPGTEHSQKFPSWTRSMGRSSQPLNAPMREIFSADGAKVRNTAPSLVRCPPRYSYASKDAPV